MFAKARKTPVVIPIPRRAGQSLAERWERLMDDRLVPIVFVPAMLWMVFVVVWVNDFSRTPPSPALWLAMAIVATGAATIGYLRLVPKARQLVQGERGERAVAEQLEELRAKGFHCFHDLQQDGFNIDHVLVGPPGVFVVETKFRSGSGVIEFRNGQGIFVDGRAEERDPLRQVRGNARAVRHLILRDTGLNLYARALVVFVGDWTVRNAWRDTDVRVLTVAQVRRFFERQDQPELSSREIEMVCSHLKRTASVS